MNKINVNGFDVGGRNSYIIADVGSNHMQDITIAKESIDAAAEAGANAIKFQSINLDRLYYKPNKKTTSFIKKLEFPEKWHGVLNEYCANKGITFFSSPTYLRAIDLLEEINVPLYKLASAQIGTFPQLVERVAQLNKPTIFSTGISTIDEVNKVVEMFEKNGNMKYIILHCNSIYPTPAKRVNLKMIETYKSFYRNPVGFSDHTIGTHIACAAVSIGAKVIEKHFTLNRNFSSPDSNSFACDPQELNLLVNQIREIEHSLDIISNRSFIEVEEQSFKDSITYRMFSSKNLNKGDMINESNIQFLRSNLGLNCKSSNIYFGKTLNQSVKKDQPILKKHIDV